MPNLLWRQYESDIEAAVRLGYGRADAGWLACAVRRAEDDLPWRARLAKWSDVWRLAWGEAAAWLEREGADWADAERIAFEQVARVRARHRTGPPEPRVPGPVPKRVRRRKGKPAEGQLGLGLDLEGDDGTYGPGDVR